MASHHSNHHTPSQAAYSGHHRPPPPSSITLQHQQQMHHQQQQIQQMQQHRQQVHQQEANGVASRSQALTLHTSSASQQQQPQKSFFEILNDQKEDIHLRLGSTWESMNEPDRALESYDYALKINPASVPALYAIAGIFKDGEKFHEAIDYYNKILAHDNGNGDVFANLGHCFLMVDNLEQAYAAYQRAVGHLQDIVQPRLWYGIGIMYDRLSSLDHAEEAFSQVMRMDPDFEKANEIYFRLGIIYKQQQKYRQSLDCFKYIISNPPKPLTEEDIWFQLGHVYEQQKDYQSAKDAYQRVLDRDPKHAKVLQQLGWLYHQQSSEYYNQGEAIAYLEESVQSDPSDAQSWYLLGRCYMAKTVNPELNDECYRKAYEAYQQAVYRDGCNPIFWCSIGVLYYQINQYRDALDAYSRAIRINPDISEVWYDLGTLYESCNNQTADALDAYTRAAELDPTNIHIRTRLDLLRASTEGGAPLPAPPELHPPTFQLAKLPCPPVPQWAGSASHANTPRTPAPLDWSRRLPDIKPQSNHGPQQVQPYQHRELVHIGPSPNQSQSQSQSQSQQQSRHTSLPHIVPRLPPSPPGDNLPRNSGYQHPPPPPPPQHHYSEAPQRRSSRSPPRRIAPRPQYDQTSSHSVARNSNYPPQSNHEGPAPPHSQAQHHVSYSREREREREGDRERPSSANAPTQHYQPSSHCPTTSLAESQPGPLQPLAELKKQAQPRQSQLPKRIREWEDEVSLHRPFGDEKRQRVEDELHDGSGTSSPARNIKDIQGQLPPPPRGPGRSPPSNLVPNKEEARGVGDYHPSEAAHHPASLSQPHPGPIHDTQQAEPQPQRTVPSYESRPQSGPRAKKSPKQLSPHQREVNAKSQVSPPPVVSVKLSPSQQHGSVSTHVPPTSAVITTSLPAAVAVANKRDSDTPPKSELMIKSSPIKSEMTPIEPAARKIEVDEDYDVEDDKESEQSSEIRGGNMLTQAPGQEQTVAKIEA